MSEREYRVAGTSVEPRKLTIPRARSVARFAESGTNPNVNLLNCYSSRSDGTEAVAVAISATVPQRPAYDIRRTERILIVFDKDDGRHPWVESLRKDFPRAPHTNLTAPEKPRSLCLYYQPWEDVRTTLTAPKLISRIMWWLEGTAAGTLHGDDQPLEPLLFDPRWDLIIPSNLLTGIDADEPVPLTCFQMGVSLQLISSSVIADMGAEVPQGESCLALIVNCEPQQHGVIQATPRTLKELHDLLLPAGVDFMEVLRERLEDSENGSGIEGSHLILLVRLPKLRVVGGEVEKVELRAFAVAAPISAILEEAGRCAADLEAGESQPSDKEIGLLPLNPRPGFSSELAAEVNGESRADTSRVIAVGVGALGSQVVSNLTRGGFGQWTLVDNDLLLPHNLGRHALAGQYVGVPKAFGLADMLNVTVDGPPIACGVTIDVLCEAALSDQPKVDWKSGRIILDMSASVAVARFLCHDVESSARRASLFLNPSGTALTLLSEDIARTVPLDLLEMQHYRALVSDPDLQDLLAPPSTMRSGVGCRDVSTQIPQDLVGLLSGIGSRAVRRALETGDAQISTWRVDESNYTVSHTTVDVGKIRSRKKSGWRTFWDAQLESKLRRYRNEKLPNETGGVLIGAFDMDRRIIYVVDATEAPADSEECRNGFLRGIESLQEEIDAVQMATSGMLGYIGEWHSHPTRSVSPSSRDRNVIRWVKRTLEDEGQVGVVGIVGSKQRLNFIPCGTALFQ